MYVRFLIDPVPGQLGRQCPSVEIAVTDLAETLGFMCGRNWQGKHRVIWEDRAWHATVLRIEALSAQDQTQILASFKIMIELGSSISRVTLGCLTYCANMSVCS